MAFIPGKHDFSCGAGGGMGKGGGGWGGVVTTTVETEQQGSQTAGILLLKADSHIVCRVPAAPMPFPCHAVPLKV